MKPVAVIVGLALLAVLFVAIFVVMARISGWKATACVWAGAITVTALMCGGAFLVAWGIGA